MQILVLIIMWFFGCVEAHISVLFAGINFGHSYQFLFFWFSYAFFYSHFVDELKRNRTPTSETFEYFNYWSCDKRPIMKFRYSNSIESGGFFRVGRSRFSPTVLPLNQRIAKRVGPIPGNANRTHLFYLNIMPTVLLDAINQRIFFSSTDADQWPV